MRKYFVLLIVYYILNFLFPYKQDLEISNRIYPQMAMGLFCIYSMFIITRHFFVIFKIKFFYPFSIFLAYLFLQTLHVATPDSTVFTNILFVLQNYMAILYMFVLYVFFRKDMERTKKWIYVLFFFQLIQAVYDLVTDRLLYSVMSGISTKEEAFASVAGQEFLMCFPVVLILEKKWMKIVLSGLILLGCLYCGERGPALTLICCLPLALSFLGINKKTLLIVALLLIPILLPLIQMILENFLMRHEMDLNSSSGYGSGRQTIWLLGWNSFWSGNILNFLFGYGINAVTLLTDKFYGMPIVLHNGWLDHLYAFGLTGLSLYIGCLFSMFRLYREMIRREFPYSKIILMLIILFCVIASISHGNWGIGNMPYVTVLCYFFVSYQEGRRCHGTRIDCNA